MVLSASRLPQALNEAPGAVTVLDRELIRASGYRDVARLLRLVPGMQIGQERGHSQWVTYHGLSGDNPAEIQVLIDGRSASFFSGVDWSALPLTVEEIERIEVVRGTNSNAYGANAFLGVVNIITRHSLQERGSAARLDVGSQGIADLQANWSGGSDDLGVRLSAARRQDNGFGGLNDSRRSNTLSLRSDYRLSARDELTLRAGYNRIERGMGYPDSLFGNNAERDGSNEANTLHLSWRRTLDEDEEWLLSLYRAQESGQDRWSASAPPTFPAVPLNRDHAGVRTNAELQHRFALNPQARLVWGLEGRRDENEGSFLFAAGRPPTESLYRAFSNLDWRLSPRWQLNLGGVFEKSSGLAAHFIPRAFVNWQASPHDTFRAGYAQARLPRDVFYSHGEVHVYDPRSGILLATPYIANPDIRMPQVDTFELGYLGRFHAFDGSLDVRLFRERISDFVVRRTVSAPPLPLGLPVSQYVNLSEPVLLRGIEYQLRGKPWAGGEVLFSHTLIDRHIDNPQIARRTSPYSASLTWLQSYGANWSSTASLLRMGPLAGSYGYVPGFDYASRPYTTLDLRVARRFKFEGHAMEAALNAINLGTGHQEIADRAEQLRQPGRVLNPTSSMVWLSLAIEL